MRGIAIAAINLPSPQAELNSKTIAIASRVTQSSESWSSVLQIISRSTHEGHSSAARSTGLLPIQLIQVIQVLARTLFRPDAQKSFH